MDSTKYKQLRNESGSSPGRVVVDSRGRNVWQWSDDQLDSTTIMLKRLDNSALALEPTRKVRRPDIDGKDSDREAKAGRASRSRDRRRHESESLSIERTFNVRPGGGFDPYNKG